MRGPAVLALAAGLVAAVLVVPASASTPPPLLFSMNSGESSMVCKATSGTATPGGTPTSPTCTITQPAGGTAWCIQRNSAQGPTPIKQTCTITQTSTTRANFAYVVQTAEHRGGASPQETTQIAIVEQGNQFKTNNSSVTQTVKQVFGRPLDDNGDNGDNGDDDNGDDWGHSAPEAVVTQIQNANQLADVCQGQTSNCALGAGMLSHNDSKVFQKHWQSEQATATDSITQAQNTALAQDCSSADVQPANMCADVDQNTKVTGSGRNKESLDQLYVQLQNARGDGYTITTQNQGGPDVFTGGLEHEIIQLGGGTANITTGQNSFQIQKASDVGVDLTQKQDPKVAKSHPSSQTGAAGTRWTGVQRAFQFQFVDGDLVDNFQRARLTYDGTTTGSISAKQLVNQNGQIETNSCTASPCAAFLECTNVEESSLASLRASVVLFATQTCATAPPDP
jgi:hypothetical protein